MPQKSIAQIPTVLIPTPNLRRTTLILGLVAVGLGWGISANASTYTVLHSFTGKPNDGALGTGTFIQDDAGNIFGTTLSGGLYNLGTFFKIDPAGKETILTKFNYKNGETPQPWAAGIHQKTFYNAVNGGGYNGAGAVITINDKKVDLLYNFCSLANCMDGVFPQYGVARDGSGNLYGTTNGGGAHGAGVIFKVDPGGNEAVLYNFCPGGGNCNDGGYPNNSGALRDSLGNLYGEAQAGADGFGVVWKLDTAGNESVLHTFAGPPSDGGEPEGQLARDEAGNLYGVSFTGGNGTAAVCTQVLGYGCGTVFKIDANGNETVLYNFTGNSDGAGPNSQALVLDKKGNLYGTASFGGASGQGTVFKLSTAGKLTVLYTFQGQSDGGIPVSGLLLDKQGVIYGETFQGGDMSCSVNATQGCGVAFKITP